MTLQNVLKYVLPVCGVLLLALLAAWAFRLPPVSALTEQGSGRAAGRSQPVGQIAGYGNDIISVSGTGAVTAKPDLAALTLGVSVTAGTVAAAREKAATSMTAVLAALAANGVAEKDIQTTHFRVHRDYEYGSNGRTFLGYEVGNVINVTVRNTDSLGAVIDSAIAAGGDYIEFNRLDYGFSNTAALEQQARKAAVADMKSKAAQLAQFSNRRLGDLMVISESPIPEVFGAVHFREFVAAAADATPILVGEESVSVTVHGVYELR